MKRFAFRLDRVLKLKEQRQRLAELRQQQARAAVERIRAEIASLSMQLQATATAFELRLKSSITTGSLAGYYERSSQLGQRIGAAEERLQGALAELATATTARTKITTEVEALLTLRERQWQVHRRDAAAMQQNQLDELALRRWQTAGSEQDLGQRRSPS